MPIFAKRWILLLMAAAIALNVASCQTRIPEEQTIIKNGRLYRIGAAEPFSGIVTGVETASGSPPLRFHKPYVKGIRQGNSEFFYPNGNMARQEPYKNGQINGIMACYYENGQLRARAHIVDGERGGEHGEIFFPFHR